MRVQALGRDFHGLAGRAQPEGAVLHGDLQLHADLVSDNGSNLLLQAGTGQVRMDAAADIRSEGALVTVKAASGIEVVLLPSEGSSSNLSLLRTGQADARLHRAEVAHLQAGVAGAAIATESLPGIDSRNGRIGEAGLACVVQRVSPASGIPAAATKSIEGGIGASNASGTAQNSASPPIAFLGVLSFLAVVLGRC